MAASDRTKQLLADGLVELSKTMPIAEIRVKDLCATCDVDRSTFYYHFVDKYDLVAWIYAQLFERERRRASVTNGQEMIESMLDAIWTRSSFFRNALSDHSQNSLASYLLDFYIGSEREVACRYLGRSELDEETEYVIRQYSYGCLGITIEWIQGRSALDAKTLARYQYRCMPDVLKRAWLADAASRADVAGTPTASDLRS